MSKQLTGPEYEQFVTRLKAKYKKEKQQRKEFLRPIAYNKIIESSQQSNDEEYIKKTVKRGSKWWGRINRHYFYEMDEQYITNMAEFTTSKDILEFGSNSSPLLPYYQQIIYSTEPFIFQDNSIRVIFRYECKLDRVEKHTLCGYCFKNTQNNWRELNSTNIDKKLQMFSFHFAQINPPRAVSSEQIEQLCHEVDICLLSKTENVNFIEKCLNYEKIWRDEKMTEIDKQIACWKLELEEQHSLNMQKWEKIIQQLPAEQLLYPRRPNINKQIQELRKALIRGETFVYFQSGYADKTPEDLERAIEYLRENELEMSEERKSVFFETDCKVCFCTKNEPNNKVIYCDQCNTSFHHSCYGIENFDEEADFLCDVCQYIHKQQIHNKSEKFESPVCQICSKSKFPIKRINNHFYHVFCLILFNFADIKEYIIELKDNNTHSSIMEAVIENQMNHDYCEYCYKNSTVGMQLDCSDPLCAKSYHIICAYLNGCIFAISRTSSGRINVEVKCREHQTKNREEIIEQVYLRRFYCNFKNTAQMSQIKFKEIYTEELIKREKFSKTREVSESGLRKIFKTTKFISSHIEKQRKLIKQKQAEAQLNSREKEKERDNKEKEKEKGKKTTDIGPVRSTQTMEMIKEYKKKSSTEKSGN